MEAVSSLQSLAGYGHGDSDIEDSDEEIDDYISVSSISDVRPQVKSSSRLVSYDDVVEEEEEDNQNVKVKKGNVAVGEDVSFMEVNMETDEVDERIALNRLEEKTVAQSTMEEVVDKGSEKTEWRLSKFKVELPPEPSGRCSNKLQDKITRLLEKKHKENIDLNASVQNRKLYRNPSIYEKLVKHCSINETGTNYPESLFDIKSWTEESFYDNLLKAQKEAHEKKEKEMQSEMGKLQNRIYYLSGKCGKRDQKLAEYEGQILAKRN